MHYYRRNIGDYHKKAGRLSMLEHGAYTLIMDAIYDREKFPSLDDAIDWVWASSQAEIDAITFVLTKFFVIDDAGLYVQKRMAQELQEYNGICQTNSVNGRLGGRPKGSKNKPKETDSVNKKTHSVNLKSESKANQSESKPNQEPLTTNQEPLTTNRIKETSPSAPDPAFSIFTYWVEVMGKTPNTKPTAGRMNKIKSRLKDGYTIDQIKQGIDGCRKSDFHMGKNDSGKKYDCLTLICRSAEKLEEFIVGNQVVNPDAQREADRDAWINQGKEDDYTDGITIDHEGDVNHEGFR